MNKKQIKDNAIAAAIIVGLCTIIGAYIGGCFKSKSQSQTIATTSGNIQAPITTFDRATNVTINMSVTDSATKDAIKSIQELENKLNNTNDKVELTKKELSLLSLALKDLDEKTSGIEKLPDGRTKIGMFIAGRPYKMINEALEASKLYTSSDLTNSLLHSQRAIKLYEDSQSMKDKNSLAEELIPEFRRKVYFLAALAAYRLGKNDLASDYARKSVEAESVAVNNALLAVTLHNINKPEEASKYIEVALKIEPTNADYIEFKKAIQDAEEKKYRQFREAVYPTFGQNK